MKTRNKHEFSGRKRELDLLEREFTKKTASLVAITGRRRIGKSTLVEKFAQNKEFYCFSGLSPTGNIDSEDQKNEFAKTLSKYLKLSNIQSSDWSDLFYLLAEYTKKRKVVILFDEISWMAQKDDLFLAKLKTAWDLQFKNNPNLMLILCGSVSSWVEKNIIASTGFLGRISLKLKVEELPLVDASYLLDVQGIRASNTEKFIYLALTGGVPWYIELLNPKSNLKENFRHLCFSKNAILLEEFDRVFNDFFGSRSQIYKKIVLALAKSSLEQNDLANAIGYSNSGALSEYIYDLVESGFIAKDYSWSFKTNKFDKILKLRLKDNYLRFYFRFISPNFQKISQGQMENIDIFSLPAWNTVLGLQFENIVLNNRDLILSQLKIDPNDLVLDNPYFQRAGKLYKGCQVDYLIQTKYKVLYLCEFKFQQSPIKSSVIEEVQGKISKLKTPKGYSICPVLVHAGSEVSDSVLDSEFFYKIVDLGDAMD